MAHAADDVLRTGGRTTWLLVGLLVLVFLAVPLWTLFGGTAPGTLQPTPAKPVATLEAGQKIAFARGDLVVGDGLICESGGMSVGAWVPNPGQATHSRQVNADGTRVATIEIRTKDDGTVIAGCS
ncbi:MAG TPA: hypothetical protein VMS63_02335 [Gaiellaceae bacterium]|nr:hypothetical protein [Gaiellaceae bacterium]